MKTKNNVCRLILGPCPTGATLQSRGPIAQSGELMPFIPPAILLHVSILLSFLFSLAVIPKHSSKNITQSIFLKKNRGHQIGTTPVSSSSLAATKPICICTHSIYLPSNSTDDLAFLWCKVLPRPHLLFEFTSSCLFMDILYSFTVTSYTFNFFLLLNSCPLFSSFLLMQASWKNHS